MLRVEARNGKPREWTSWMVRARRCDVGVGRLQIRCCHSPILRSSVPVGRRCDWAGVEPICAECHDIGASRKPLHLGGANDRPERLL